MSYPVKSPVLSFTGLDGTPLEGGSVYIGASAQNPETNQIQVWFDEAMTIPAAQPLKTAGGYVVRNGTPARIFIAEESYSITVKTKRGELVFYSNYSIPRIPMSLIDGNLDISRIVYDPLKNGYQTLEGKLAEWPSVSDFGYIGDGTYHPIQEWVTQGKYADLAAVKVDFPKVTSLAQSIDWAAIQKAADYYAGSSILIPHSIGVITDTVIFPKGTISFGEGKFDIWIDDASCGTVITTYGTGNPQRWHDITGSDPATDTPMFVAGGPGVYFRNMALRSDNWSIGLLYPSVRQCGFSQILALGFTDACVYIDMTWSEGNTVMNALHPDVFTDGAANEFSGFDFYLRSTGAGSSALKIQGTTRAWDSVASSADWLWCPGGVSDCRFLHGRLNGSGLNAACFSQDAQLYGVNAFGQGVTLRDVALRLSNGGRYMAKLDRANRTIFDGCYGEYSGGSNIPYFAVTSRTKTSNDGIIRVNDKLNGRLLVDEVDKGSLSTVDWLDSRCVSTYRVDGRVATPNIKALDVAQPLELTTFDNDGIVFNYDDGTTRTPMMVMGPSAFRSNTPLGSVSGTSGYPWLSTNTKRVTYDGDMTIDPSGVLNLNSSSINSVFVIGDTTTPVFRPLVDAGASLGTTTFLWQNGRFHNLYSDSGTVSVSDIRKKKDYEDIPDAVLDVWGNIRWIRYKLIDGTSNRWHTGSIAQWILQSFADAGLDARDYGIVCYESWDAVAAKDEIQATYDEEGNEITKHQYAVEAVEAGDMWSVRYEEMLAFEAAWNRRELARVKASMALLEDRIKALEGKA